jgi:hypothetical protein
MAASKLLYVAVRVKEKKETVIQIVFPTVEEKP